jgi:outer membrane receptor protein involved in Fe transport
MVRAAMVFVVFLGTAAAAAAQTGSLSGTIVDEQNAAVPSATVLLSGPGVNTSTTSGARGEYVFRSLQPGTYRVTARLVGFAAGTSNDIVVESSDVQVPAITLTVAGVTDVVVVTASRAEVPLLEAPATMSVVGSDVIASTPAQNYGDLLRAVPGLNVVQMSARDVNLTSRQSTSTLSNSQLVLLDGRSVYLDFFGIVLWDFLPSNVSDIKQIEVIRGPASAVWGANALTGVVNVLTKSPREAPGVTASLSGGWFDRGVGSSSADAGGTFGANATLSQIASDRISYRVSAGFFNSDAYARPSGRIPVIGDPRDPTKMVGGATYPADGSGPIGTAFANRGTTQPKFDARVDQEVEGGRITYSGGVAGSSGIIHTGIGPFDIQRGSTMGYGRVAYNRGALNTSFFVNYIDAQAPNLLLVNPATRQPLQLDFSTQTYDFSIGDSITLGRRQILTFGGNARRNNFDITIAPALENRTELGAYVQDEIFTEYVRFVLGGRVDKFGNLSDPVFSPRLAAVIVPRQGHSVRVSFNRAFRSPSVINNYLDTNIVVPTDLSGLAPLLPPPLRPLVATPFPLTVRAVGSRLPIGTTAQEELREESLTAYEAAYTVSIGRQTSVGAAFYVNDHDRSINFSQLPRSLDPYTAANPPPGWQLPPALLAQLALGGVFLPRTAFTYLNLGPIRQKGLELSVDHRFDDTTSAFVNYSWQADPTVLSDPNPYPTDELALPPTSRFNVGVNYDGRRFLGSGVVSFSDRAFWSDVLTSDFHGYTDSYTLLNAAFGVKWANGRVTTLVKGTNLLNQDIQQHVFGDVLKRAVIGEVRFNLQ